MASKDNKSILNHYLVPMHEIVPENEAKEIIKKYGNLKEKFPLILRTDPVIEEIQAKKGDLIRITRNSLTAGKSVSYRIVG
ncbi:MAG: DNA-directed RNA polymerase subunit H [Candidatus Diapherotrites archaeon]